MELPRRPPRRTCKTRPEAMTLRKSGRPPVRHYAGLDGVIKRHRQLVRSGQPDARRRALARGLLPPVLQIFCPDLECFCPGRSLLGRSDVVAAEMEEVVDLILG
jgi:hypothetical protein